MGLVAIASMAYTANEAGKSGAFDDGGPGILAAFYTAASAGAVGLGYAFAGASGALIGGALAASPLLIIGGIFAAGAVSNYREKRREENSDHFAYYTKMYEQRNSLNKKF